jgi:hypothetical protein
LRYKIKHVQIRSLTGSDRSDRRRFKRSATDLTFFGQGSLTLTTLSEMSCAEMGKKVELEIATGMWGIFELWRETSIVLQFAVTCLDDESLGCVAWGVPKFNV